MDKDVNLQVLAQSSTKNHTNQHGFQHRYRSLSKAKSDSCPGIQLIHIDNNNNLSMLCFSLLFYQRRNYVVQIVN